jgi:NADP-reducing hydrogenase subunit HndD
VNFFEHNFPDMLDVPSTAKSPQQMFGAIAKTYFADKLGIKRQEMVVVSIMPCLAKKYECSRPEFAVDGNPDVDISISTRELAQMIATPTSTLWDWPTKILTNRLASRQVPV